MKAQTCVATTVVLATTVKDVKAFEPSGVVVSTKKVETVEKVEKIEKVEIQKDCITVVYDPGDEAVADIVFVHGLMGSAGNTWRKKEPVPQKTNRKRKASSKEETPKKRSRVGRLLSWFGASTAPTSSNEEEDDEDEDDPEDIGVHWPRDVLPKDVKNARVLLFDYDANVHGLFGPASQNSISQHAANFLEELRLNRAKCKERPLIFIAHSMGGLVTKEMLRQSHMLTNVKTSRQIYVSTYGIVFMGTPHRGSNAAAYGDMIRSIIKSVVYTNDVILKELSIDAPMLRNIHKDFVQIVDGNGERPPLQIYSFFEEKGLNAGAMKSKIVEDFSGSLGIKGETVVGINANHQDMTKFDGPHDPKYRKVKMAIESFIEDIIVRTSTSFDRSVGAKRLLPAEEKTTSAALMQEVQALHVPENLRLFKTSKKAREAGTCEWLFEGEQKEFVDWMNSNGFLWMTGKPGRGKSIISSSLVEGLQSLGETVLYFFFKSGETQLESAGFFIKSILFQLVCLRPEIARPVKERLVSFQKEEDLWDTFEEIARNPKFGKIFCVIDGLDECPQQEQLSLLDGLGRIHRQIIATTTLQRKLSTSSKSEAQFNVFIASRPSDIVSFRFKKITKSLVILPTEKIEEIDDDILSTIGTRFEFLSEFCGYDDELCENLKWKLLDKAEGMFLYVSLVLKILENVSPYDALDEIETLPSDLPNLYDQILGKVSSHAFPRVQRLLSCLVYSSRALTLDEIPCFMEQSPEATKMDEEDRQLRRKRLLGDVRLCGPILEVQSEDTHNSFTSVTFIHETVRKYFLTRPSETAKRFVLDFKPGHYALARTCLGYLNNLRPNDLTMEEIRSSVRLGISDALLLFHQYPLLNYAVLNLFTHIDSAGDAIELAFVDSFIDFSTNEKRVKTFLFRWRIHISSSGKLSIPERLNIAHLSVFLENSPLFDILLDRFTDEPDDFGWTSIHWAAHHDKRKAVEALLKRNPLLLDLPDLKGTTPLLHATCTDSKAVCEFLLQHNPPPNIMVSDSDSQPLHHAASTDNYQTVQSLLRLGADADARRLDGCSPLHLACRSNGGSRSRCVKTVEALLRFGANVNGRDRDGNTPLHFAAGSVDKDIIKLLLKQNGVNVDAQNDRGMTPLILISRNWRAEACVPLLLAAGADVNFQDPRGETPLIQAAWCGNETMVSLLIQNGASIEAKDNKGNTALFYAIDGGPEKAKREVVEILLEAGARVVNSTNLEGMNSIHLAARYGEVTPSLSLMLSTLRTEGGDASARTKDGWNAWHFAAFYGNFKNGALEVLFNAGIDPTVRTNDGKTVIHLATEGPYYDSSAYKLFLRLLVEKYGLDINETDALGRTPLHCLLSRDINNGHNRIERLHALLELGADVKARCNALFTPIFYAAQIGLVEAVKILLKNGSWIEDKAKHGGNILHVAAQEGNPETLQLLVEHGLSINSRQDTQLTPLHFACKANNVENVKFLLEKGAEVNAFDEKGSAPIHVAAAYGSREALSILLQRGCDPNFKDTRGQNLISCAILGEKPSTEVVQLLLEAGTDPYALSPSGDCFWSALHYANSGPNRGEIIRTLLKWDKKLAEVYGTTPKYSWLPLHDAASSLSGRQFKEKAAYIPIYLEAGVDVGMLDMENNTALHFASTYENYDAARILLKAGAPLTIQNESGSTPIHLAAQHGHYEIVKEMLDYGVDINILSVANKTPLHRAAAKGELGIVELLVERGASVTIIDMNGHNALFLAVKAGEEEVVEYLLENGADCNIRDNKGRTMLEEAIAMGHREIEELLLSHGVVSKRARLS